MTIKNSTVVEELKELVTVMGGDASKIQTIADGIHELTLCYSSGGNIPPASGVSF